MARPWSYSLGAAGALCFLRIGAQQSRFAFGACVCLEHPLPLYSATGADVVKSFEQEEWWGVICWLGQVLSAP